MQRILRNFYVFALCCGSAFGQNPSSVPPPTQQTNTIRMWIAEREVKSVQGGVSSVDLMKELNAKCEGVVLTDSQGKADYRLEAGYAWCCTPKGESRGYKFALFNKDGDAVFSTKTHTLANAVRDVCKAIGHEKGK